MIIIYGLYSGLALIDEPDRDVILLSQSIFYLFSSQVKSYCCRIFRRVIFKFQINFGLGSRKILFFDTYSPFFPKTKILSDKQ